jgi:UDP-glucose 4-epimerase
VKVLVTGGGGVVGSYVVRELVDRGERPLVIDLRVGEAWRAEFSGRAEFDAVDISQDGPILAHCLRHRPDVILHLAALTGAAPDDDPMVPFRVNMLGTMHVLEAARGAGVRRVVMASTRTVYPDFDGTPYGHPTYRPVPEDHWLRPDRPYEIWKHAAERIGAFYRRKLGIEFAAFRFAVYYAAERTFDPGGRAMGLLHGMIGNAVRGGSTVIPSGGDRGMDCVYVRDLARAFALAAASPTLAGDAYNIGTGRRTTPREFAAAVAAAVPGARLEVGPGTDFAPGHYCVLDVSRARADFGYEPAWPLEAGIADCVRRTRDLLAVRADTAPSSPR